MKKNIIKLTKIFFLLLLIVSFILVPFTLFYNKSYNSNVKTSIPKNLKVAFIGDQGLSNYSKAVLKMIKEEKTDVVLHQGDFDYEDNPEKWHKQINKILGPRFPYFGSIGNHDADKWPDYQKKLKSRLNRIKGIDCKGDLGVKSVCSYKGLFFLLLGPGIEGKNYETYIKEQLSANNFTWRICSWHKNQRLMQVGGKLDEVGWQAYEECRKNGAIIATAHEHSYSRTYLMNNFENQTIASKSGVLHIRKNKTFAFVSALGGKSIRRQNDTLAENPWWASVYLM